MESHEHRIIKVYLLQLPTWARLPFPYAERVKRMTERAKHASHCGNGRFTTSHLVPLLLLREEQKKLRYQFSIVPSLATRVHKNHVSPLQSAKDWHYIRRYQQFPRQQEQPASSSSNPHREVTADWASHPPKRKPSFRVQSNSNSSTRDFFANDII